MVDERPRLGTSGFDSLEDDPFRVRVERTEHGVRVLASPSNRRAPKGAKAPDGPRWKMPE